jgi:hypothetical protein
MLLNMTGGILAIKLKSILEVSAGSIKKVGPGPKYWRSNTYATPLYCCVPLVCNLPSGGGLDIKTPLKASVSG